MTPLTFGKSYGSKEIHLHDLAIDLTGCLQHCATRTDTSVVDENIDMSK